MTQRATTTRRRGAAMVEFAIVAPLFIALVFTLISYGWMLSYRQAVSQGAADAARTLAVGTGPAAARTGQAEQAVSAALGFYGVTCRDGRLVHSGGDVGSCTIAVDGTTASIAIDHDYRRHPLVPSFPGLGFALPDDVGYQTSVQVD